MLKDQRNSRKQGDVGLGAAIGYFTSLGYTVCIPLTDNQNYDLVIDDGYKLKKVEIKTTYHCRYSYYQVDLRTHGGNRSRSNIKLFDNTAVDFVFIYTDNGDKYLIPAKDITAKSVISLGKKYTIFKVN